MQIRQIAGGDYMIVIPAETLGKIQAGLVMASGYSQDAENARMWDGIDVLIDTECELALNAPLVTRPEWAIKI